MSDSNLPTKLPPSWLKRRIQKAGEAVEQLIWGAIFVSVLGLIWYFFEGFRGAPMFIAIGFFSAIILTIAATFILKFFKSRPTPTDELSQIQSVVQKTVEGLTAEHAKIVEGLNKQIEELEGKNTTLLEARGKTTSALEEAKNKAAREVESARTHSIRADLNMGLLEQIKTQYGWLHREAENDKRNINKYVYIIFRKVKYEGLDEIEPYIEIYFDIINASVYNILINKDIQDGAVYFNNTQLKSKDTELGGSLHSISRGENERRFLVIKQWVSPELVERIKNPQPDDKLYFNRLWINVGVANNSEIRPQRLSLPSEIPIQKEVAALQAENESLKSEINTVIRNHQTDTSALERRHEGVLSMMDARYKGEISGLQSEMDSLKAQLEERNLKFEIALGYIPRSSITLTYNKDVHHLPGIDQPIVENEYLLDASFKILFKNAGESAEVIEGMELVLLRDTKEGEQQIRQENDLDIYPENGPFNSASKIKLTNGLRVEGRTKTPYYTFQFRLTIQAKDSPSFGADCFLRLTMRAMVQKPYTIDIRNINWEIARNNGYVLSAQNVGSTPNS